MAKCLISFGANIGDALGSIEQAAKSLRALLGAADSMLLSRFYNTPPVGGPSGQPPFVNAVAAVHTQLSPWEMWHAVRQVEHQLGRQRFQRWEARRIDLDILLYDDQRIWTPQLKIPHPRMCMRRFILEPAMDVAPDWLDPVSRLSVHELAIRLRGSKGNLVLCADRSVKPQVLLEEVARQALAEWKSIDCRTHRFEIQESSLQTRWVAWLPLQHVENVAGLVPIEPTPKLLMLLPPHRTSGEASWEDVNKQRAIRLRLTSADPPPESWSIAGARYLLATDDHSWAVHEMVAALDAMDCPVEPLS